MKSLAKNKTNILLIVLCLFIPAFIQNGYIMLLVNQVLIYVVAVLGLNYITGLSGENNMGMAGIFAIGSYLSAVIALRTGCSPFIGLLLAIPMGVGIGLLLGYPSLRVKGIYLALSTMMFGEVVRLLMNNLSGITGGSNGLRSIPVYFLGSFRFKTSGQQFYLYFAVCLIAIFISQRIIKGRWGRAFISIRDNEDGVSSCGIDVARVKVTAFMLCAIFGCVSGAMFAHLMGYISPNMFDSDFMVKFFMMLMLGGIGTVRGAVIGSAVVVILPELLRFMGDYYWLAFSVLMLLIIVFAPYGISSIMDKIGAKLKTIGRRSVSNP